MERSLEKAAKYFGLTRPKLIFTAGLLAERRLARGVILNYPETIAYISAALLEGARDGLIGVTLFLLLFGKPFGFVAAG